MGAKRKTDGQSNTLERTFKKANQKAAEPTPFSPNPGRRLRGKAPPEMMGPTGNGPAASQEPVEELKELREPASSAKGTGEEERLSASEPEAAAAKPAPGPQQSEEHLQALPSDGPLEAEAKAKTPEEAVKPTEVTSAASQANAAVPVEKPDLEPLLPAETLPGTDTALELGEPAVDAKMAPKQEHESLAAPAAALAETKAFAELPDEDNQVADDEDPRLLSESEAEPSVAGSDGALPNPQVLRGALENYPDKEDILLSACKAMLAQLCDHDVQHGNKIRARSATWKEEWQTGSGCTGSAAFEMCVDRVLKVLGEVYDRPMHAEILFGCEHKSFKQQFAMQVIRSCDHTGDTCMYQDMTQLHLDDKRKCVVHGEGCDLRAMGKLDIFASGFSCTSLSPLNAESGKNTSAFADNKACATVETFGGCLTIMKYCTPEIVLLENVPKIDSAPSEDEKSNLEICMAKLQDVETARYEVRSLLVSSLHYGVPQNRQRVYILAVRSDEVGQAAASKMVDEAVANVHRMTLKAPPVDAFLLPDDSPPIAEELSRLQTVRKQAGLSTGVSSDKSQSWVSLHMSIAEKRGVAWPIKIPDELLANEWFQTLPSRQREVLALAALDRAHAEAADDGSEPLRFADIYHSGNRFMTSGHANVPVILPHTTLWDFHRARLIVGRELLRLQAITPKEEILQNFTEAQMGDLSGNAFTATVMAAMLLATITTVENPTDSEQEEAEQIDAMMGAMDRLANVSARVTAPFDEDPSD